MHDRAARLPAENPGVSPGSSARSTVELRDTRTLEGWQLDPANLPYEGPGMSALSLDARSNVWQ